MLSLEWLLLYAGFGSWAIEFSVARLSAVEAEVVRDQARLPSGC